MAKNAACVFDPSRSNIMLIVRVKWFYASLGTYQASFRLDERSILPVHLVVESAGVAKVMAGAVPSPQWRRRCAAVHALATLYRRCTVKNDKSSLISRTFHCVSSYRSEYKLRSATSIEHASIEFSLSIVVSLFDLCATTKHFVGYVLGEFDISTSSLDLAYLEKARARWLVGTIQQRIDESLNTWTNL